MVGAEALLRWDHPTRGLLGPDVFIDVAEQSGLITSIGEWVLIQACQQAVAWPGLRVSVNLSVVQFHLEDSERFMQRLQNLKGLGVQLAIDDFGTGYSNLAYLQQRTEPAIVTAIIQMAAEGIETSGAKAALANLGCESGQGYLFSRPMPASAFNDYDYMQERGT